MNKRMNYNWDNKEQLINDLKNSYSMTDFLKKQNFISASGNFQTFRDKIKAHNIDLKNIFAKRIFIPKSKNEYKNFPTHDKILCENSEFPRSFIRKFIKKNNLVAYVCRKCGNNGIWQGEPLTLELEHKNGNSEDNRLENLEYLCLNCHSQTLTYCSKNVHLKLFNKRIKDLCQFKIIDDIAITKLAILWDIKIVSVKDWISNYKEKIQEHNIEVNFRENCFIRKEDIIKNILLEVQDKSDKLKIISNTLNLSDVDALKIIRLYDFNLYKELDSNFSILENGRELKHNEKLAQLNKTTPSNYLEILPNLWNLSNKEVTLWIKKYSYEYYKNILKYEQSKITKEKNDEIIVRELNRINQTNLHSDRIKDVINISNKKEVLMLSKKWQTSVNGAKKWIRNNLPDKFKEIYDDKHLLKNQNLKAKQEKEKYVQSLKLGFNEEEAMSHLDTNKSGLFALIRIHNPKLMDELHSKHPCPKCNSKTRTNGKYQRCIKCNHNFTII